MSVESRRGVEVPTRAGSPAVGTGLAWRSTDVGRVVPKAEALALRDARRTPRPEDLIVARVSPASDGWTLDLTINYATRAPGRRRFPFCPAPAALSDDGWLAAAFLFVAGPEPLPPGFAFPRVHVVDVTERGALGHAPSVDFAGAAGEQARVTFGEAPPEELFECVCIPGVTFDFDRSFIRPTVVDHLQRIDAVLAEHPGAKLFVVGHTDRVGDELYNKRLSDRRALSTVAFITNDAAAWESLYQLEGWGLRTVQVILDDLGHDPGPADGLEGPRTRRAMRSFLGLPDGAPVRNDAPFRARLFDAYMTGKHDVQAAPEQFVGPRLGGCGEWSPLVPPNEAELANKAPGNEPNRRVVVYLFERDLPAIPCAQGDIAPCKAQLAAPGERRRFACAFYDDLSSRCSCEGGGGAQEEPAGKLHVQVLDLVRHTPVADRAYELASAEAAFSGVTDADGLLLHPDAPEGEYFLRLEGLEERLRVVVLEPDDPEPLVRFVRLPARGKLHVELLDVLTHEPAAGRAYEVACEAATFSGTTDEQGALLHEDAPAGDYVLRLDGLDEALRVVLLEPDDPEPLVRLVRLPPRRTRLRVQLHDRAWALVKGAACTARSGGHEARGTTDDQGWLDLEVVAADVVELEVATPRGPLRYTVRPGVPRRDRDAWCLARLRDLGFSDPRDAFAVHAFQVARGLEPSGRLDDATVAAIEAAAAGDQPLVEGLGKRDEEEAP